MEKEVNNFTFNSINYKKIYNKLSPDPVIERTGNYDIRDYIRSKWDKINGDKNINVNTNLQENFVLIEDKGFEIIENLDEIEDKIMENNNLTKDEKIERYLKESSKNKKKRYNSFSHCISPHMLLYRCCCTFPDNILINDEYKQIWTCWLKNKETSDVILISEWKGTPYLGLNYTKINELHKDFLNDILELLNYLLSDQCVHPYDNLVAGTIA